MLREKWNTVFLLDRILKIILNISLARNLRLQNSKISIESYLVNVEHLSLLDKIIFALQYRTKDNIKL